MAKKKNSSKKQKGVKALISIKADTDLADEIGKTLSEYKFIEDVLFLTGNFDFIVKASFESYDHMKRFLTLELPDIEGVENSNSMMVVSAYKERHEFVKAKKPEEEEQG